MPWRRGFGSPVATMDAPAQPAVGMSSICMRWLTATMLIHKPLSEGRAVDSSGKDSSTIQDIHSAKQALALIPESTSIGFHVDLRRVIHRWARILVQVLEEQRSIHRQLWVSRCAGHASSRNSATRPMQGFGIRHNSLGQDRACEERCQRRLRPLYPDFGKSPAGH